MNLWMALFLAVLFVLLTPGILLRIPANGTNLEAAVVHSIVFVLIWWVIYKPLWQLVGTPRQQNLMMVSTY
jgi:hypothetical protein